MKNILIKFLNARRRRRQFKFKDNIATSLNILEAVIKILDRHNIDYYLDFGTLIGALREKAFIPWDDDVDISLLTTKNCEEVKQLIIKELDSNKLKVTTGTLRNSESSRSAILRWLEPQKPNQQKVNFKKSDNLRIIKIKNFKSICTGPQSKFLMKFGILSRLLCEGNSCLDIFIKYDKDDRFYWIAQNRIHSLPKKYAIKELVEVDFYHLKCKIPRSYNEYLTAIYGDWQVKKENWQYYEKGTCASKTI